MSGYSNYRNPPVTYLERAEALLLEMSEVNLPANKIALAQALIALAEAQMKGRSRV